MPPAFVHADSDVKQGGLVLEHALLALAARLEAVPEDGAPGWSQGSQWVPIGDFRGGRLGHLRQ